VGRFSRARIISELKNTTMITTGTSGPGGPFGRIGGSGAWLLSCSRRNVTALTTSGMAKIGSVRRKSWLRRAVSSARASAVSGGMSFMALL
jgi:hypothetical protein